MNHSKFNFKIGTISMIGKIWKFLSQVLFHRSELTEILKPFLINLNNNNINDEKYIPILKSFSKYELEALWKAEIISVEKIENLKLYYTYSFNHSNNSNIHNNLEETIDEIISGDKIKELQELIQKADHKLFNTIIKPFNEFSAIKIPLIQYCVMKNAIECFKFLLINGFSDPNQIMEPTETYLEKTYKYKWDCMATSIYLGKKIFIRILEDKGIKKYNTPNSFEAAILSFRNQIAKEIIDEIQDEENNNELKNIFDIGMLTSSKNNNIKGIEVLLSKGADINAKDIIYLIIIILFLIKKI